MLVTGLVYEHNAKYDDLLGCSSTTIVNSWQFPFAFDGSCLIPKHESLHLLNIFPTVLPNPKLLVGWRDKLPLRLVDSYWLMGQLEMLATYAFKMNGLPHCHSCTVQDSDELLAVSPSGSWSRWATFQLLC